jgi:hypothetical protein
MRFLSRSRPTAPTGPPSAGPAAPRRIQPASSRCSASGRSNSILAIERAKSRSRTPPFATASSAAGGQHRNRRIDHLAAQPIARASYVARPPRIGRTGFSLHHSSIVPLRGPLPRSPFEKASLSSRGGSERPVSNDERRRLPCATALRDGGFSFLGMSKYLFI